MTAMGQGDLPGKRPTRVQKTETPGLLAILADAIAEELWSEISLPGPVEESTASNDSEDR